MYYQLNIAVNDKLGHSVCISDDNRPLEELSMEKKSTYIIKCQRNDNNLRHYKTISIKLFSFVFRPSLFILLLPMDMPKWVIKMIDKIRRGFLWKRRKEVNGGSFLVSWEKVARPIDLGRPGSPNLQMWDGPCKCVVSGYIKLYEALSWASNNPIHPQARAMFAISVTTQDGSVNNTLYWSD